MTITIDYNNDRVVIEHDEDHIEWPIRSSELKKIEGILEELLNRIDPYHVTLMTENEDVRSTVGEW